MNNATEASKIVRNLVASGQIRNYRRSKWQQRRLHTSGARLPLWRSLADLAMWTVSACGLAAAIGLLIERI